jgi:hypothetical protein
MKIIAKMLSILSVIGMYKYVCSIYICMYINMYKYVGIVCELQQMEELSVHKIFTNSSILFRNYFLTESIFQKCNFCCQRNCFLCETFFETFAAY